MPSLLNKIIDAPIDIQTELLLLLDIDTGEFDPIDIFHRIRITLHYRALSKAEELIENLISIDSDIARAAAEDLAQNRYRSRVVLAEEFLLQRLPQEHSLISENLTEEPPVENEERVGRLLGILSTDPDPKKRASAAERLGELGKTMSIIISRLQDSLQDIDGDVVKTSLMALIRLHCSYREINNHLEQVSSPIRAGIIDCLAREGMIHFLFWLIHKSEGDSVVKLIKALAKWQMDQSISKFNSLLDSADADIRGQAVRTIGLLCKYHPKEPASEFEKNRETCISLIKPKLKDLSGGIRRIAFIALDEIDYPDVKDIARDLISDPFGPVRVNAVEYLGDNGDQEDIDRITNLFQDKNVEVSKSAFGAALRLGYDQEKIREHIIQMLNSSDASIVKNGLKILVEYGQPQDFDLLSHLLYQIMPLEDEQLGKEALETALKLSSDKRVLLKQVRKRLKNKAWDVRAHAVGLLGEYGGKSDLSLITARFKDKDENVRQTALNAAIKVSPGSAAEFASELITDKDFRVCDAAFKALKKVVSQDDLIEAALKNLPRAKGESSPMLFDLVMINAPNRRDEAVKAALKSRSEDARLKVVKMIAQKKTDSNVVMLRNLLKDRYPEVRLKVMEVLFEMLPEEAPIIAIDMLEDSSISVRKEALNKLAGEKDPLLVDDLLPLARDEDEDIRCFAIEVLSKFDDVRVFRELISSLNDVDEDVREKAEKILSGKFVEVPSLKRLTEKFGDSLVKKVKERVEEINRWATHIGQELLGKPVMVYNYRQGLGRTDSAPRKNVVDVEISDTPVTSGHPMGEDIMRGLALHEIGHHLYHIGVRGERTMRGIARSEGIGDIYDFLKDEQLERALRSRRPDWGVYFDRLASYAFAQNTHEVVLEQYAALLEKTVNETRDAIFQGEIPGELVSTGEKDNVENVFLRDSDMLAIPGLVPVHLAFLSCLRCGFNPETHPDPRVAKAVGLVPPNLRDLEPRELLEVARKIGEILGKTSHFKKAMKRFLQQMRLHREIMRQWINAIDLMAETGQLPEWLIKGASGIRKNRPTANSALLKVLLPKLPGGQDFNSGKDLDFLLLDNEEILPLDPAGHGQLVAVIRKHIRRLRAYFERMGTRSIEQYASRRGRRLDLAQVSNSILRKSPNLLVHSHEEISPDAYIGILIDRSGSMDGDKIELAKRFSVLVAESLKGLRGISGHVNAFDDDTFIWLGNFQRNAIASLVSGGGNNDSGALARAADLAMRSRKNNRLLVMISDGSPTECTFESLKNLVAKLTHDYGIVCVQVAVEKMEEIAFPNYVDLSRYSMDEAVARFGNMLIRLTDAWR